MFGITARSGFEEQMIEWIMDTMRVGGLIPRKDDPTRQALDFEPSEYPAKVFQALHSNCMMLCQDQVMTPVAADMIRRYLSGASDLMGRPVHRGVAGLLETIDSQIKYHTNPDMNIQHGIHAMINRNNFNVAMNGMAPLFGEIKFPLIQQTVPAPDRETLKNIEDAVKDLFERNGINMPAQDITLWCIIAVGNGFDSPLTAMIKIATMYFAETGNLMLVAPDEGNTEDFVASVIWDLEFSEQPEGLPIEYGIEMFRKIAKKLLLERDNLTDSVTKQWVVTAYEIYRAIHKAREIIVDILIEKGRATDRSSITHQLAAAFAKGMQAEIIAYMPDPKFDVRVAEEARRRINREDEINRLPQLTMSEIATRYAVTDPTEPKSDVIKQIMPDAVVIDSPIAEVRVTASAGTVKEFRFERNDDSFVITREYGLSPNGNPLLGSWVCRNFHTGEYIDHDKYRADLAGRLNIALNGE